MPVIRHQWQNRRRRVEMGGGRDIFLGLLWSRSAKSVAIATKRIGFVLGTNRFSLVGGCRARGRCLNTTGDVAGGTAVSVAVPRLDVRGERQ